jgi:hypothetical protein
VLTGFECSGCWNCLPFQFEAGPIAHFPPCPASNWQELLQMPACHIIPAYRACQRWRLSAKQERYRLYVRAFVTHRPATLPRGSQPSAVQ